MIPVYKTVNYNSKDFRISKKDYEVVEEFVNNNVDKLLVVRDGISIQTINSFKRKERLIIKDEKPTRRKRLLNCFVTLNPI